MAENPPSPVAIAPMLLNARAAAQPPLALRPREAAKAIGISERTLWTLTKRGQVPHLRLGRSVLYPVDLLREYLRRQSTPGGTS